MRVRHLLSLLVLGLASCAGAGTELARGCPFGFKACDGRCVRSDDPAVGCNAPSCDACVVRGASARCGADGACTLDRCLRGHADCDRLPANGCETRLADTPTSCGACGRTCAAGEICRDGRCVDDDVATLDAWLRTQRGGFCGATFNQLVTLCDNPGGAGYGREFCFDKGTLSSYPDGVELHVGFHWDGRAQGNVASLGGDCDQGSISLSFGAGALVAFGPNTQVSLSTTLAPGTHLVTFRRDAKTATLLLDGVLVASSIGTGAKVPELITTCGPGIVLGHRASYWWEATPEKPDAWAKVAPFFFHLRDMDKTADPNRFSFEVATTPGPRTRMLFDASGVAEDGTTWNARDGVHRGRARNGSRWAADGLACLRSAP